MKYLILSGFVLFSINSGAETKLGTGAQFSDAVPLSQILKTPESFVGHDVTIAGTITEVCEKRGCWMRLTTDVGNEKVRVKVKDGEIVFPVAARGKKAAAHGKLEKVDMTLEQTKAFLKHEAEENKKKWDPASVKHPIVMYQVQATGAVIE